MCYFRCMTTVGLRELRQDASALLRRVEAGDDVTVTVSGRPVARLVRVEAGPWTSWEAVADLFNGEADETWDSDREAVDSEIRNPWTAE